MLIHQVLTTSWWGRCYYYSHFTDRSSQTTQGHSASEWQSWAFKLGRLTWRPWLLATSLTCFWKMSPNPTRSLGSCQMADEQAPSNGSKGLPLFPNKNGFCIRKKKSTDSPSFSAGFHIKPIGATTAHSTSSTTSFRKEQGAVLEAGCIQGFKAERLVNLKTKKQKSFQTNQCMIVDDDNYNLTYHFELKSLLIGGSVLASLWWRWHFHQQIRVASESKILATNKKYLWETYILE